MHSPWKNDVKNFILYSSGLDILENGMMVAEVEWHAKNDFASILFVDKERLETISPFFSISFKSKIITIDELMMDKISVGNIYIYILDENNANDANKIIQSFKDLKGVFFAFENISNDRNEEIFSEDHGQVVLNNKSRIGVRFDKHGAIKIGNRLSYEIHSVV